MRPPTWYLQSMRALWALCAVLGCTPVETAEQPPPQQRRPSGEAAEPDPTTQAKPEPEPEPMTPPEPASPPVCIATYSFDSHASVLAEQRSLAGAKRWDDFATRYSAAYLDPDRDHPVELVASIRIGDTPLLWFTADYAHAVVNAAVLSALKVVDATSLRVDERVEIGALTELGHGKIGGRELTEFLLKASVIQTFAHIGSTLCLLTETRDDQGGYRAEFSGEHEYFTNRRKVDEFGFVVALALDGGISVTGASPQPYSDGL